MHPQKIAETSNLVYKFNKKATFLTKKYKIPSNNLEQLRNSIKFAPENQKINRELIKAQQSIIPYH